MASYTIGIQEAAWLGQADRILERIERVDSLLDQLADEAVLPILERHYDASGIKAGGVYQGNNQGLLKRSITKRGAYGNVIEKSPGRLTVGVSYEQVPYARWVIEGRGPVYPKRAKVLRWIDQATGKVIFAKRSGPAPPHPIYFLTPSELGEIETALTRLLVTGE